MDDVAKRQAILALFCAVLACKATSWLRAVSNGCSSENNARIFIALQWSLVDAFLLAGLWYLQVPRMCIRGWRATVLAFSFLIFNWAIYVYLSAGACHLWSLGSAANSRASIHAKDTVFYFDSAFQQPDALMPEWPNGSHPGVDVANTEPSLDTNIAGTYVVKIRPWATAEMNTDRKPLCVSLPSAPMPHSTGLPKSLRHPVGDGPSPSLEVPVSLSGIGPWRLQLAHVPLSAEASRASSIVAFPDVTTAGITIDPKTDDAFLFEQPFKTTIPVREEGVYELTAVFDGTESQGRVRGAPISVMFCPEARLDGVLVRAGTVEVCNSTPFDVRLWLRAPTAERQVSPFAIVLELISDVASHTLVASSIVPVSEPDREDVPHGHASAVYSLDISKFFSPGDQFLLRIASVQDASGSTRTFGGWERSDAVIFNVHTPPSIEWANPAENAVLRDDRRFVSADVELRGRGPFTYELQLSDHSTIAGQVGSSSDNFTRAQIPLYRPGTYKLKSIADSVCSGTVSGKDTLLVEAIHAPSLVMHPANNHMRVTRSECGQPSGMEFLFLTTGLVPIKISGAFTRGPLADDGKLRNANASSKVLSFDLPDNASLNLWHSWKPTEPGHYRVVFDTISDLHYSEGVKLKRSFEFEHDIFPEPHAAFASTDTVHICRGGNLAKIDFKLSGSGPWSLEYEIVGPSGFRRRYNTTYEDADGSILLDPSTFKRAGAYRMLLTAVTDSSGCPSATMSLSPPSINVVVHSEPPSASFVLPRGSKTPHVFEVREGTAEGLPIVVHSNSDKAVVVITHDSGERYEHVVAPGRTTIHVTLSGQFQIASVRDDYTLGVVGSVESAAVRIIQRPSAAFLAIDNDAAAANRNWACQSASNPQRVHPVLVGVVGTGKITLAVQVQYAPEEQNVNSARRQVLKVTGTAPVVAITRDQPMEAPGFYRYELISISDQQFSNQPLGSDSKTSHFFMQQVLPDPAPRLSFVSPLPVICVDSPGSHGAPTMVGKFLCNFIGSPAYSGEVQLTYSVYRGDGALVAGGLQAQFESSSAPGMIVMPPVSIVPGTHYIHADSIDIANGCSWSASAKPALAQAAADSRALRFEAAGKPVFDIAVRGTEGHGYLCSGDVARVFLGGIGPWTVQYSLGDSDTIKSETTSQSHIDIPVISTASIAIKSICNKHCCTDSSHGDLRRVPVHTLPSAHLTEGHQVLREGETADMIVLLRGGSAPYSFTYERLDEASGKIIERISVENVAGPEQRISVSAGGVFRIAHVEDRFCRYPPISLRP